MIEKAESDIIKYWNNKDNISVTINCIAYNQEKFIEKAIDSFLMQQTDFAYEILIHDDASDDGTAEIIKKYENKYPNIVKGIYEDVNQWSNGNKNIFGINCKKARGKYIALCEGDDFFSSEMKLQKCFNFMEKHPDFSACTHQTNVVDLDGNYIRKFYKGDEDVEIKNLDSFLTFPHTSSYFFKNPYHNSFYNLSFINKFNFVSGWDKSYVLYFFATGKIYYSAEVMSCYRYSNNQGSGWTYSMGKENRTKLIMTAELAQLNQIKEYKLKINMAPHYYRNVMMYSLLWFIKTLSIKNLSIFLYAFRNCPRKLGYIWYLFTFPYRKVMRSLKNNE